jgi:transposase
MIGLPTGVRVWIAAGHTDMRRGMQGLARQVQEALHRDPHAGDLYVFRGRSGSLVKILWHDGIGMSLYAKRLERSPHRSLPTCWTASTGEIPSRPFGRARPAELVEA